MLSIKVAEPHHFIEAHSWLKAEKETGGSGFYCNIKVIEKLFMSGNGLCAISGGKVIGFVVFQMYGLHPLY